MASEGLPPGEMTIMYGRNVGKSHMAAALEFINKRNKIMGDGSVESIMEQWKCSNNSCPNFIDEPIAMCDSCDDECKNALWEALKTY